MRKIRQYQPLIIPFIMKKLALILLVLISLSSCKKETPNNSETSETTQSESSSVQDSLIYPEEKNFKSLRQVTFGGDNAEAYWSFDDKQLIFQSNNTKWGVGCDQMFLMNADETLSDSIAPPMVSTGKGRTTCSYFLPDNKHIIYASTHLGGEACPEVPNKENGKYIWPIYDTYDIFMADLEGNIVKQLTDEPGSAS